MKLLAIVCALVLSLSCLPLSCSAVSPFSSSFKEREQAQESFAEENFWTDCSKSIENRISSDSRFWSLVLPYVVQYVEKRILHVSLQLSLVIMERLLMSLWVQILRSETVTSSSTQPYRLVSWSWALNRWWSKWHTIILLYSYTQIHTCTHTPDEEMTSGKMSILITKGQHSSFQQDYGLWDYGRVWPLLSSQTRKVTDDQHPWIPARCKCNHVMMSLISDMHVYLPLLYYIYNEKYFSDDQFSNIVRVLTWRA